MMPNEHVANKDAHPYANSYIYIEVPSIMFLLFFSIEGPLNARVYMLFCTAFVEEDTRVYQPQSFIRRRLRLRESDHPRVQHVSIFFCSICSDCGQLLLMESLRTARLVVDDTIRQGGFDLVR